MIEDEVKLAGALQMVLSEDGYEVDVATSVRSALDQLHQRNFDLLVVNLCLPDIGGWAFIRKITREQPDAAVIVTTTNPSVPSAVEAMKLGVEEYLPKPFGGDEFKTIVMSTLKKQRGSRSTIHPGGKESQAGALIQKWEVLAVLNRAAEDENSLKR